MNNISSLSMFDDKYTAYGTADSIETEDIIIDEPTHKVELLLTDEEYHDFEFHCPYRFIVYTIKSS